MSIDLNAIRQKIENELKEDYYSSDTGELVKTGMQRTPIQGETMPSVMAIGGKGAASSADGIPSTFTTKRLGQDDLDRFAAGGDYSFDLREPSNVMTGEKKPLGKQLTNVSDQGGFSTISGYRGTGEEAGVGERLGALKAAYADKSKGEVMSQEKAARQDKLLKAPLAQDYTSHNVKSRAPKSLLHRFISHIERLVNSSNQPINNVLESKELSEMFNNAAQDLIIESFRATETK